MSLLFIKTQDLTWQDRALNIEVMLEPKKTQLLFKKNKSLSMRCEKDRVRYEKQKRASVRNYKTEKRYMDERNQELYLIKTQRFLQSIPPDMKQQVLNRRSFSISLTKLAKDINDGEENARASAPPNMVGCMSRDEGTILPAITIQTPEPPAIPDLPIQQVKSSTGVRPRRDSFDWSESNSDSRASSRINTPIPSYLPSVQQSLPSGIMKTRKKSANALFTDKNVKFAEEKVVEERPLKDQYQEEKLRIENLKPKVQRKVNSFLLEQSRFNKRGPISKTELSVKSVEETNDICGISKRRLVSAFDEYCELSSQDNYQKLVKYATKYKVASQMSSKIVPSVDTVKASRSFLSIQNPVGLQTQNRGLVQIS